VTWPTLLHQLEPLSKTPFGYACPDCGKPFKDLYRRKDDARLAAALHHNACKGTPKKEATLV